MSQSISSSVGKKYGLARVCTIWGIPRSTYYWHKSFPRETPSRRGPIGLHTDEELVENIRQVLTESPFTGEGYRKAWARLRARSIRTSPKRVLRLMRENGLLAKKRGGKPRGPKVHDGTIKTERVDEMWGSDMTTTLTISEGNASIFFVVDHCSLELLGIHATRRGTRFEALEPIRQAVRHSFGSFDREVASGVVLRHDNGSQFVSRVFQDEMKFLGIASSPSFIRQPQGNGIAERFVRILKENLLWLRLFDTVEDLRQALLAFQRDYNENWILGRHGYRTPAQVRQRQLRLLREVA